MVRHVGQRCGNRLADKFAGGGAKKSALDFDAVHRWKQRIGTVFPRHGRVLPVRRELVEQDRGQARTGGEHQDLIGQAHQFIGIQRMARDLTLLTALVYFMVIGA